MNNSIKTDDVIFNFFKQICDEKDDKKCVELGNNWINAIDTLFNLKKKKEKNLKISQILLLVLPVSDSYNKNAVKNVNFKNRVDLLKLLIKNANKKYNIKIETIYNKIYFIKYW